LALNASLPDLGGKQRTEPVPPEPHRLVADINAALEKQILYLADAALVIVGQAAPQRRNSGVKRRP
jgi:hypothetical protein